jgi:integrase
MRNAPQTYGTKAEAERYLTLVEADLMRGDWLDPEQVKIRLQDYAERWIIERAGLRPRTVQLYRWTLKKHITPYLGDMHLGKITTPMIRQWRVRLAADGVSPGMVAKAYRLLRAILWTAVREDELLRKNPCRIQGADQESPAERPHLSLDRVHRLMDAMPDKRYRMFILTAALASLRFGEVTALRRRDVDMVRRVLWVQRQFLEVTGKGLTEGPVKSAAGVRDIAVPREFLDMLAEHMEAYVGRKPDALLFTTTTGRPIRRGGFEKLVSWRKAVASIGYPGLHFHDLRHTGNMFAAASGASARDLMARMGHDSMNAALIYLHRNREADQRIADHLGSALRDAAGPSEV